MNLRCEPDATATALAEARAELKRMRLVYKAVARFYRIYSDVSSESIEGTFPREMVAVHRAFARAEHAKEKKS